MKQQTGNARAHTQKQSHMKSLLPYHVSVPAPLIHFQGTQSFHKNQYAQEALEFNAHDSFTLPFQDLNLLHAAVFLQKVLTKSNNSPKRTGPPRFLTLFVKAHIKRITQSMPKSPFTCSNQLFVHLPTHATCRAHFILLDVIIEIIFVEEYK
jgi:hypothetical protein